MKTSKAKATKAGLVAAATVSLLLSAAPVPAQEGAPQLQPTKDQDATPGLQQTPDGQTMKTVGEKPKYSPLADAASFDGRGGGSTGPTFPHGAWGK